MRDSYRKVRMDGVSKPLKHATYLLRFTPEDKAELERKVRLAAARGNSPLTLAQALREGAEAYLDDLLEKLPHLEDDRGDLDESARVS